MSCESLLSRVTDEGNCKEDEEEGCRNGGFGVSCSHDTLVSTKSGCSEYYPKGEQLQGHRLD